MTDELNIETCISANRAWPITVTVRRYPKNSGQSRVYVDRGCYRGKVTTSGATGHAECCGCGARVDQGDRFCRACGCRLVWKGE